MTLPMLRVLVTVIVAAMLGAQARRASGPRRRRAFGLGALAFSLFAFGNLLAVFGAAEWLIFLATVAGLAAMVASLTMLFFAYRAGEFQAQVARARELIGEERRRYDDPARRDPNE